MLAVCKSASHGQCHVICLLSLSERNWWAGRQMRCHWSESCLSWESVLRGNHDIMGDKLYRHDMYRALSISIQIKAFFFYRIFHPLIQPFVTCQCKVTTRGPWSSSATCVQTLFSLPSVLDHNCTFTWFVTTQGLYYNNKLHSPPVLSQREPRSTTRLICGTTLAHLWRGCSLRCTTVIQF